MGNNMLSQVRYVGSRDEHYLFISVRHSHKHEMIFGSSNVISDSGFVDTTNIQNANDLGSVTSNYLNDIRTIFYNREKDTSSKKVQYIKLDIEEDVKQEDDKQEDDIFI